MIFLIEDHRISGQWIAYMGPPGKTNTLARIRSVARFLFYLLIMPALLFPVAGRLDWTMAWIFIAVNFASTLVSRLIVYRKYPDLIEERAHFTELKGVKEWDKRLVGILLRLSLLPLPIAALNLRYGWEPAVPLCLQYCGLAGMIAGLLPGIWAMAVNRFFSAVVRIQTERGHTVVSSGPYRYVRHPAYIGGIIANIGFPLMLGSFWALIPVLLLTALYIVRTAKEDRTLLDELPGYREYADKVRYRLIPGVW